MLSSLLTEAELCQNTDRSQDNTAAIPGPALASWDSTSVDLWLPAHLANVSSFLSVPRFTALYGMIGRLHCCRKTQSNFHIKTGSECSKACWNRPAGM